MPIKKTGTMDALNNINDLITTSLDQGKHGVILIDLQKAFDTIDKNILFEKLNKLGIRGKCKT